MSLKKKTELAKETKWKRQNTYDTNVITSIRSIWQSEDMVKELMFIIYILKIEDLAVLLTIWKIIIITFECSWKFPPPCE